MAVAAGASFPIEQFRTEGWVRIRGAFTAAEAAAMRDAVWHALEGVGIRRDDPGTWSAERPDHLQHLKSNPVFQAVGNPHTLAAIDQVLAGQPWRHPSDWGAFFIVFPGSSPWNVPGDGWHIDADYAGPLDPPRGVKVHAMFGDVGPRCGGMHIISGSHRLVHRWFVEHPPRPGARSAALRKSLHQHPYLRALCTPGDAASRLGRFTRREEIDGTSLEVLENTAAAGDVILMHPLLLHAPPIAHLGSTPRFLLNKDIYL